MLFSELGLRPELQRAIEERGYTEPTPIQAQAIPAVLSGKDLLAAAQTGTGKTAGFTLPLLERLMETHPEGGHKGGKRPIRALILTPTRELAAQVEQSVLDYGHHLPLKSMVMFGGVGINPQIDKLKKGVDILVATPGRLLDHQNQRTVDLSQVEVLVLDEADRMLDMGFIHDIKKILKIVPEARQNLLFSATFSDEIRTLAGKLLDSPAEISVTPRNTTVEAVSQSVYEVDRDKKRELLAELLIDQDWQQVLVFTRTKHGANRLAEYLSKRDIPAMAIHGNKSQTARTKALESFKNGTIRVLVATDIAARGIDIAQLPYVVNFELPNVAEDYVHRIGRTGRAGESGEAISLVCIDEHKLLAGIERLTKQKFTRHVVPGFEPDPNAKPEPIPNGRNNAGGGRRGGGGRPGGGQGGPRGRGGPGGGQGRGPGGGGRGPGGRPGGRGARGGGGGGRSGNR
ncbi:DEAD/DEAH box helicase [Guyparkeria sp. SCN-R1]|uniref:DEAD/DEAH box helicase n=1 Tax=Guyparkeria sp. SCN-R1 TaxID=2341113 RepID=UPI000F64FE83|nr:DEAD/DEAH box helicase [Guyparkeria sp. SCN-R1]RRQ24238.1 DEAD/DEAH box helicase [Guyparkeria sp. SCN-R1]